MGQIRRGRRIRTYLLGLVGGVVIVNVYWFLHLRFSFLVSIVGVVALLFLLAIIGGYHYNWRWTGIGQYSTPPKGKREWHHRKTLWDWMQFLTPLSITVAIAILGTQFTRP